MGVVAELVVAILLETTTDLGRGEDCVSLFFLLLFSLRARLLVALRAEVRWLRLRLSARDFVVPFTGCGSVRVSAQFVVCVLLVLRSRGGTLPKKI